MTDATPERYYMIIDNIKAARKDGNKRKLKLWRNKLTAWQLAYGAYAPND